MWSLLSSLFSSLGYTFPCCSFLFVVFIPSPTHPPTIFGAALFVTPQLSRIPFANRNIPPFVSPPQVFCPVISFHFLSSLWIVLAHHCRKVVRSFVCSPFAPSQSPVYRESFFLLCSITIDGWQAPRCETALCDEVYFLPVRNKNKPHSSLDFRTTEAMTTVFL